VLVAAERELGGLAGAVAAEDDVVIAAVTAAELLVGIELADRRRRPRRARLLDALLETVPVEPYDLDVARAHGRLLAAVRKAGRPRGAHDLIIAATAAATERVLVTVDEAGFADLPGVEVRAV
jgi:tRNA(fMet)-specific endonuclease VapC